MCICVHLWLDFLSVAIKQNPRRESEDSGAGDCSPSGAPMLLRDRAVDRTWVRIGDPVRHVHDPYDAGGGVTLAIGNRHRYVVLAVILADRNLSHSRRRIRDVRHVSGRRRPEEGRGRWC